LPGFVSIVERGAPVGVLRGDGWQARYQYTTSCTTGRRSGSSSTTTRSAPRSIDDDGPMVVP
jgi:hypothetical protein